MNPPDDRTRDGAAQLAEPQPEMRRGGDPGLTTSTSGLRRDLGRVESYATLLGILIGAGIFRVTSDAWALTGSSVLLGYLVLAPAVLATSVPYAVFLSTPLGRAPGGEYAHISRTFGDLRLAFVGAWLKIVSYIGALAYLAHAFADYVQQLAGGSLQGAAAHLWLALATLGFFYAVHVVGVRWFGRVQVIMCIVLGASLCVLILPGLRAVRPGNYAPFFTHGAGGFAAALPLLFFSYAGFESLAQTAGEVRESTRQLPRVFLRGVLATCIIFALMSVVTFGVVPGEQLRLSTAPMAEVASVYLPRGWVWIISVGALMAIATSLNATMLVPSRLAVVLAQDGLAPRWLGAVQSRTGTPVRGLTLTFALAAALLVGRQVSLALGIAVFALVLLYLIHSATLLFLARFNPALHAARTVSMPVGVQRAAAAFSVLCMGALVGVQVHGDVHALRTSTFVERAANGRLTSLELLAAWSVLGLVLYRMARAPRLQSGGGSLS